MNSKDNSVTSRELRPSHRNCRKQLGAGCPSLVEECLKSSLQAIELGRLAETRIAEILATEHIIEVDSKPEVTTCLSFPLTG